MHQMELSLKFLQLQYLILCIFLLLIPMDLVLFCHILVLFFYFLCVSRFLIPLGNAVPDFKTSCQPQWTGCHAQKVLSEADPTICCSGSGHSGDALRPVRYSFYRSQSDNSRTARLSCGEKDQGN